MDVEMDQEDITQLLASLESPNYNPTANPEQTVTPTPNRTSISTRTRTRNIPNHFPIPTPTVNDNLPNTIPIDQLNHWSNDHLFQFNLHQPTPTRSGRIPQRPTSSLLDFLIFPEESESDDPDFDPFKETIHTKLTHNQSPSSYSSRQPSAQPLQTHQHHNNPELVNNNHHLSINNQNLDPPTQALKKSCSTSSLDLPSILDSQPSNSNPSPLLTSISERSDFQKKFSSIDFNFSALFDHPYPPLAQSSIQSTSRPTNQSAQIIQPVVYETTEPCQQSQSTQSSPATYQSLPPPKLSSLTQDASTGVPFIHIDFPESDDSPEFIPPPPHPPSHRSSSSCSSAKNRTRKEQNSRQSDHDHHLLDKSHTSSSRSVNKKASSVTRDIDPCLQSSSSVPKQNRQEPIRTQSIQLPPSISSRYIAIAPSPNYPKTHDDPPQYHTIEDSDDNNHSEEDGASETSIRVDRNRAHQAEHTGKTKNGNSAALPRSKPGPKPKGLVRSSSDLHPPLNVDDDRDDAMKRKREGMRQSRERKKLYIVSLEDRCLELAEENARLKEENQVLLRESRENWKSKAKSLEMMKILTTEIERLKQHKIAEAGSKSSFQETTNQERSRKLKRSLARGEEEGSRIPSSSSSSYLLEQDNKIIRNKRKRHDDDHIAASTSLASTRPRGRTLLDLVAVKPR